MSIERDGIACTSKLEQTLFDELPEIPRTYFWNEDSRRGHYPFDDRLGPIGRHAPGRRGTSERAQRAKALLPLRTLHKSNRLEEFFQHLVKDLRQVDCAA